MNSEISSILQEYYFSEAECVRGGEGIEFLRTLFKHLNLVITGDPPELHYSLKILSSTFCKEILSWPKDFVQAFLSLSQL